MFAQPLPPLSVPPLPTLLAKNSTRQPTLHFQGNFSSTLPHQHRTALFTLMSPWGLCHLCHTRNTSSSLASLVCPCNNSTAARREANILAFQSDRLNHPLIFIASHTMTMQITISSGLFMTFDRHAKNYN